jgi:hypothetical protein
MVLEKWHSQEPWSSNNTTAWKKDDWVCKESLQCRSQGTSKCWLEGFLDTAVEMSMWEECQRPPRRGMKERTPLEQSRC